MSQTKIIPTARVHSFPPLAYKNVPVLTTEMLAQAYEVEPKQIRQNFANNKERFIEGKHFFSVYGQELKTFLLCVENFDSQISPKVRVLTLWTDRGCARHAKSLNTDRAWDMYELLEETFFSVVKPEALTTSSSPELPPSLRSELKALVDAKLSAFPASVQGKARSEIWTRFNRNFKIAEYAQLPAERMAEARDYLIEMEVKALKALSPSLPKALPSAEPDYTLTPAQAKFMPSDLPSFVKEMETTINSMTYLVNRMEISGHPSGLTWGQLSRNKPLYEAVTENIQSARAACVAGLRMLKSVKLICTGVR